MVHSNAFGVILPQYPYPHLPPQKKILFRFTLISRMVLGGGKKSEIRLQSEDSVPCYMEVIGYEPIVQYAQVGSMNVMYLCPLGCFDLKCKLHVEKSDYYTLKIPPLRNLCLSLCHVYVPEWRPP